MKSNMPKNRRYAIGRGTRVKHSTAMEWDEFEKKKRKYPVIYSTGTEASIVHSTGGQTDKKAKETREQEGNLKRGGARHPGFTYKNYRESDESDQAEHTP